MGSGHLEHDDEPKTRWDAQAGFDRDAALERLAEHPEVLPPHPEPYRAHKREAWGLRVPTALAVAAAGIAVPLAIALGARVGRPWRRRAGPFAQARHAVKHALTRR